MKVECFILFISYCRPSQVQAGGHDTNKRNAPTLGEKKSRIRHTRAYLLTKNNKLSKENSINPYTAAFQKFHASAVCKKKIFFSLELFVPQQVSDAGGT